MKSATYLFGDICVDASRMTVTRNGAPVALEPKALDVLLFLLEHRDRLVTKEEILDAVWKDTFVTPNVMTRAVAQLRKALGDDAEQPRIIETASRRGYRVIADVRVEDSEWPTRVPAAPPLPPPLPSPQAARRPSSLTVGLVGLLLVAAAVGGGLFWSFRSRPTPADGALQLKGLKRLSTRTGYNAEPALSADGRQLAYVSDQTGALEIYVRNLAGSGAEYAVTSNGAQNVEPEWSPDGNWIAFHSKQLGGIWVVPSAGGTARQVADFGSSPAWAPDSNRIAFSSDSGGFTEQAVLWSVKRDGSERTQLTDRETTPGGTIDPVWSHNGKFIAFTNSLVFRDRRMWVLSLADRSIHPLPVQLVQAVWGPGDRWIYSFALTRDLNFVLTRVPIDPATGDQRGNPEELLPVTGIPNGLSFAADGTLVYALNTDDDNLWRVDVKASGEAEPARLTNDAVRYNRLAYSSTGILAHQQITPGHPVGTRVLDQRGKAEMLLPDGEAMNPQWSADGTRILVLQQKKPVWIDLATRSATPAGQPLDQMSFPRLAPDDLEVAYHRIEEDGHMRTFVRRLDSDAAVLIADDKEGVGFPVWSPDGRRLAVEIKRGDNTFIGLIPRAEHAPVELIVTDPGNNWPHSWSRDGRYIAFAGERKGVWNVWIVDVTTRQTRQITHFTLPLGYVRYPVWSPGGDHIVFERQMESAAIWTIRVQ